MRFPLLILLVFIFCNNAFAQIDEMDTGCREKCSRASAYSRILNANYYQYPSMDKYDIKYLKLNLDVEPGTTFVSGTALTVAKVMQTLDSFNIELRNNMTVDSVYINGVRENFSQGFDYIFVPLAPALPIGSTVSALIYYKGTAGGGGIYAGTTGSGLTYTATLSESYQAREWFPAKQFLKDKIDSTDIWIKTGAINKAGSNGLLVAVVDSPNNKKQYQWKTRYPMNYYMPSIAVGNYREYLNYAKPVAMAPDSILIQHYIADDDTYFNSVKTNLDKTPAFIETYSDLFGLYPFKNEKYGHCQASIGGGMEHQTMSTMNSFGSTLIAHELGHQWWGDNVTCASWNHIWLNEGFASYCEYLAIEKLPALFPTTTASAFMQSTHNNVLSSPAGSVFVPNASLFDENRIFSGRLTYNKGSAIIHTLRFEMQDDNLFFQTLKNYQQQYKNSVATADDFKLVAETTSGKNLTDFFNQWYYGEGYPTFNITYLMQGADSIILIVNQTASAPSVTPFFKGLYEFTITSEQGDTTVKAYVSSNDQFLKFKYSKNPTGIIVDPNNWVLNNTGLIVNGGVVPIKLLSFNVTATGCIALLNWKTNYEQHCKQYDVEVSTDGNSYQTVGSLNCLQSNDPSLYQYSYNLNGSYNYFFRLKIINEDGSYFYSEVLNQETTCSGSTYSLNVSPNPVTDQLYAIITMPVAGSNNIKIFNAAGALVYNETMLLNAGENRVPLTITQKFAAGTYIIKSKSANGIITKKFVKR